MAAKKAANKPRKEDNVREKIGVWLEDHHPAVEIQKVKYGKLIEATGEIKIIDASLIGYYKKRIGRPKKGGQPGIKGVILAELEFEEHESRRYSILKDMCKITSLLRKLYYHRGDLAQYWIKVDRDGTPFMINYNQIKKMSEDKKNWEKMPATGKFTKPDQLIRIIAAKRPNKKADWPDYVIIGWDDLFKELDRLLKFGNF